MDTMTWYKFFPDRFISRMHLHPNNIVGQWIKAWCTMSTAKERWSFCGTISEWSRVIGECEKETIAFLEYVNEKFADVTLETFTANGVKTYKVCDQFYQRENHKGVNVNEATTRKVAYDDRGKTKKKKTPLAENREKIKQRIKDEYHPLKRNMQSKTFAAEMRKLLKQASSDVYRIPEKIEAENMVADKIVNYIKKLKKTRVWKGEAKFLPGLGNFILRRMFNEPLSNEKSWESGDSQKDSIKDKIMEEANNG